MIQNPGKCHDIGIGVNNLYHQIILNNKEINISNKEKLLCILSDSKLNFDSFIIWLCK